MLISNLLTYIKQVGDIKKMFSGSGFPVFGYKGNVIVARSGMKSYCYELISNDLEQVSTYECDKFAKQLIAYFNKIPQGVFFKFLSLDSKIFINSNLENPNIPFCKLKPVIHPFKAQFGRKFLYSDLSHGCDFLKFNNYYLRIINFEKLTPNGIDIEELSILGDYIVQFEKKNTWIYKQKLEIMRNIHLPNLMGLKRNIQSEKAYSDIERVLDDIIDGREVVLKVCPSILIYAKSFDELSGKTDLILSKIEEKGYIPRIETEGTKYFFQNLLFGVRPSFKYRSHEVITSYLINLLPVTRDYLMDDGFKLESMGGNDVYFDIFSQSDNANVWICGPSGRGKSYLNQYIQHYYIKRGAKVLILEYGKSHEKLCKWHKAAMFNKKANFLQFKDAKYLRDLVLSIVGREEPMSKVDQGRLFDIISDGVENKLFETNSDFIDYLEKNFKHIKYHFSLIREYFTDDIVKEDAQVVYCDIKEFPDEIKEPMMIFLFEWFKSWKGRRIFVFDEINKYLKDDFRAESISDFARDKRKEGASIFCITQHINDILRYPFLDVIYENSDHRIFFEHSSEIKVELNSKIKDTLLILEDNSNLGQADDEIKEFSKFLITCGKLYKIVILRKTNLDYELFTSKKEDIDAFKVFLKERGRFFPSFKEKIKKYVEIKYAY